MVSVAQITGASTIGFEGSPAFTLSGELAGIVLNWPCSLSPGDQMLSGELLVRALATESSPDIAFAIPTKDIGERVTRLLRAEAYPVEDR